MADGDLLEVFDAPEIAILADGPEIEARHPERLCADLRVPAIEAAEVEIGRAVRQPSRLDRIKVVDQEQEDITVRGIQRGRVFADVDPGIVDARGPIEHAGNLPSRVAGAVACDPLHGGDQFMVIYTTIVGAGDCAQFNASILDLERLDQLGAMRGQPVLKIDGGKRCWELAQIGSRRADHACELTEAPVCRRKWHIFARQHQRQPLGVVAVGFHPYCRALGCPGPASLGAAAHGGESSDRDRYRSSAGRENHSEDTRPIRSPRLTSTL